jgi:hypothetical protein
LKAQAIFLLALSAAGAALGDDIGVVLPADEGAYETDRPGEIENPFVLPVGGVEIVDYVVGANGPAREDAIGGEGSAVFMDTALRVGLASRVEGIVSIDSILGEGSLKGSRPESGLGDTTVAAKWDAILGAEGDYGVGLAPFVRLPLNRSIGGTSRPAFGLIAPFDFDLEGGWGLQGSTGVTRSTDGPSDWTSQWENQVSIERTLAHGQVAYLELQVELGEGPAAWSTEFGVSWHLGKNAIADIGGSVGLGADRARMSYAGLGWHF